MWWIVLVAMVVLVLALLYSMLKISAEADVEAERWERELRAESDEHKRAA